MSKTDKDSPENRKKKKSNRPRLKDRREHWTSHEWINKLDELDEDD